MTGVVADLAMVVASAALLCGHQGVTPPLPRRGAWRGLYGRLAASRAIRAPRIHPTHERAPHASLWARSQPLTYEETA
ncbi:hypothetical protein KEF29_03410 [Streptomyces tuirus]|uniref:Uncharacterized protein n=1 Tax=Streptomyces tuirus TaxID=68278 RepID=A0A941J1D6_9ACTN|nr:hypothetical protein [Streptomyces tuirus]